MRVVRGVLVVPPDAPRAVAGLVIVEVRDVSLADAPSVVVAECRATDVSLVPGGSVAFELRAPEAEAGRRLALRGHVSLAGSPAVAHGDLLTTSHIPVPPGDVDDLEVPLRVV